MVALPREVAHPRAAGYGARVGDLYVRLGSAQEFPINLVTADSLADRQENRVGQQVNTYENLMELGFVYSRFDLSGGEGLDTYPRPSQSERTEFDTLRFWDSNHIAIHRDINGIPPGLKLSRKFALKYTKTVPVDIAASATQIMVADGTDIDIYDGWADATATSLSVGVTVVAVAASPDGDIAAIDTGGSVWISEHGAAFTKELDGAVDDPAAAVWYAKGRFLANAQPAAGGATLVEIVVGGANLEVDTARDDFVSVVDAGMAIVGACKDGTLRTYVPQTDTAGAAPILTQRAQTPVPPGETPYSLGWNAGILAIKTAEVVGSSITTRVYRAEVLDARFDYLIGGMQLRRTWENTSETIEFTDEIARTRDELFWTIRESATTTSVWRMDIISAGISRYAHIFTASEVPIGLIGVDDSLGIIGDTDVYWLSESYQDFGWMISPKINFGLHTPINWIAAILDAQDLTANGAKVELYYSLEADALTDKNHSSWIQIQSLSAPAQAGIEIPLLNITGNAAALQIRIYPDVVNDSTPLLTRFAIRGLPKHRDWIVDLPINVSDLITARGRRPVYRYGWGDQVLAEIINMQGDQIELTVYKPDLFMRGIIEQIGEPFTYIGKRGSAGKICTVRFRGAVLGSDAALASAGMGLGTMGLTTMGIDQLA